jgi:hypothetical protein
MGCLLLVGRKGRRGSGKKNGEKNKLKTKKQKKQKKICIPVGETNADGKGC